MKIKTAAYITTFTLIGALSLTGCSEDTSAEKIGRDVDKSIGEMKEGTKEVREDIKEGAKDLGEEIEKGAKELNEESRKALEKLGDDIEDATDQ